ncbi:VOC family protein [Candidatus Marinimicrobia bacterium]|nr:VOC family protein [Candidatus Neomarinimicrobiota bacterium]
MDSIDHIAVQTDSIIDSVKWYKEMFSCEVEYEDDSWALLKFENTKLALVIPNQHPPHIAVKKDNLESFGSPVKHRDGSESVYVKSPDNNTFELIRYPK